MEKHEEAKREAAEKRRRQCTDKEEENPNGLASVRAVKIMKTENKTEQQIREENRKKHIAIIAWVAEVNRSRQIITKKKTEQWNQPNDWRVVTQKTLHKYIPFENPQINLTQAFQYVMEKLKPFGAPKTNGKLQSVDTPIWGMSKNQIRNAVYKAAITRKNALAGNKVKRS